MMPNLDPSKMKKMMKQMGMKTEEINTTEIIFKVKDGNDFKLKGPSVTKIDVKGNEMYQVQGGTEEEVDSTETTEDTDTEFDESDVETLMEQTGCTREEAEKTLSEEDDLAKAVMKLSS